MADLRFEPITHHQFSAGGVPGNRRIRVDRVRLVQRDRHVNHRVGDANPIAVAEQGLLNGLIISEPAVSAAQIDQAALGRLNLEPAVMPGDSTVPCQTKMILLSPPDDKYIVLRKRKFLSNEGNPLQ